MKKILSMFAVLLLFLGTSCANADPVAQKIQFIYINGSNSNNESAKDAYIKGFNSLHKEMKKEFESNEFILSHLLNNQKYSINPDEDILFWGFSSKAELDIVKDNLEESKKNGPIVAHTIRSILAHCMHDAIWVQREHNMQKIIDQLNKKVIAAHSKGEKVVLLGHSAGSFVTVDYIHHKAKGFTIDKFTGKNEHKYTCLDAVANSGMGYMLTSDRVVKNPNEKQFAEAYKNIDKYNELYCAPDDTVIGIVNFGSPFSLFYSSLISRTNDLSALYQSYFLNYIIAKNIFFLTVNFADDPVGFPVTTNVTKSDIEMEYGMTMDPQSRGFIYNYSKVRSGGMFATAHFGYWKHPKRFAKTVREAYIKGYNNFYSVYKI